MMLETLIQKILNLHEEDVYRDDFDGSPFYCGVEVIQSNGERLEWEDYLTIDIPKTKLEFLQGDVMYCDYILYFGDGTIEFHDAEGLDAYNWGEIKAESINEIENLLHKMIVA